MLLRAIGTRLANADAVAQFFRDLAVGLSATGLYFAVSVALVAMRISVELAHVVALVVRLSFSYAGQKIFTFRLSGNNRRFGARFVTASAAIVLTQFALVQLMRATGLGTTLLFAASAAYYPVVSYFVHSFWTFRSGKADCGGPRRPLRLRLVRRSLAGDIYKLRRIRERVCQLARSFAHEIALLRQKVPSVDARGVRDEASSGRQHDAIAIADRPAGGELLRKAHVHQPVLGNVFLDEDVFEAANVRVMRASLSLILSKQCSRVSHAFSRTPRK